MIWDSNKQVVCSLKRTACWRRGGGAQLDRSEALRSGQTLSRRLIGEAIFRASFFLMGSSLPELLVVVLGGRRWRKTVKNSEKKKNESSCLKVHPWGHIPPDSLHPAQFITFNEMKPRRAEDERGGKHYILTQIQLPNTTLQLWQTESQREDRECPSHYGLPSDLIMQLDKKNNNNVTWFCVCVDGALCQTCLLPSKLATKWEWLNPPHRVFGNQINWQGFALQTYRKWPHNFQFHKAVSRKEIMEA